MTTHCLIVSVLSSVHRGWLERGVFYGRLQGVHYHHGDIDGPHCYKPGKPAAFITLCVVPGNKLECLVKEYYRQGNLEHGDPLGDTQRGDLEHGL